MLHPIFGVRPQLDEILAAGSTTARSLATRASDIIHLLDHGCKFDGVTDDAAAIQAAHDALPSEGGTLIAPRGKSFFAKTLNFSKRIQLIGQGYSEVVGADGPTTFLKASTLNGIGMKVTGNSCTFQDFLLDGVSGNGGDGISVEAGRVTIRNVSAFNQGNDGIRIGTDAGVNANLWRLDNVYTKSNGRDGVRISDKTNPTLPDANGGTCTHLDTQGNTADGLHLGNTLGNTFVGVTPQTNGANGVHLSADADLNVFFGGDWNEANVTNDLLIDSGASDNSFIFPRILSADISDSGTRTMLWHNDASGTGSSLRGLFDLRFESATSNYVRARQSGGYLNIVTDGLAATDANAILRMLTDGLVFGKSGTKITKHLSATATLDFPSIAAQSGASLTITVTGAVVGETVTLGIPAAAVTGSVSYFGYVSAADTVTVRAINAGSGAADPTSATFRADVWQH